VTSDTVEMSVSIDRARCLTGGAVLGAARLRAAPDPRSEI
jgi:hypothetical protein